jgi:hypothetical protein
MRCVTRPRSYNAGDTWMSTRSVTQRQGLLTFDEETQNLLMYCQLYASQRFGIGIVASQNEPTHSHEILYDPDGFLSDPE